MISFEIFDDILNDALEETVLTLAEKQVELLNEEVWDWPRETIRANGEVVSSPRNIIDQKTLINSLDFFPLNSQSTEWTFIYNAVHASIVHNGAILNNGTIIPARPWVTKAYLEVNPYENIKYTLQSYL